MGAQAKQRPTPAPLYTAKREAATDKKPPKPPRLAVTAARKNSGGYERQGQVSPSSEDVILYPFRSSTSKAGMRVFAAAEIFMCDECAINALAEKAHNKAMHPTSG